MYFATYLVTVQGVSPLFLILSIFPYTNMIEIIIDHGI